MDTAQDERATLDKPLEGDRDQIADWRKDDGGVAQLGRGLVRPARPFATKGMGKLLGLLITGAREGEDAPALMPCDLRHNMGCGSKAEDRESLGWTCCLEGTIPDEPCTQQRRRVNIIVG